MGGTTEHRREQDEAFVGVLIEAACRDVARAFRQEATLGHRQVASYMVEELDRYADELLVSPTSVARLRTQARVLRTRLSSLPEPPRAAA